MTCLAFSSRPLAALFEFSAAICGESGLPRKHAAAGEKIIAAPMVQLRFIQPVRSFRLRGVGAKETNMDRRSFIRLMFMAGGAIVTGAALMPREAQAASLFEPLKDMESTAAGVPAADLPAEGAQEAVIIVRRRRPLRRRVCVTRVGPRGRVRRVCRIG
jgi:hypothetical protein